jgi:hypothetical protein
LKTDRDLVLLEILMEKEGAEEENSSETRFSDAKEFTDREYQVILG